VLNHPNLAPWPFFEADEVEAATRTLISGQVNYWTGELGKQFEKAYAKSVGMRYGIALSNGTVALELALRALNIQPGDEVIVASRSYVASASCVLLIGAIPVFADVDYDTGNISADTIKPLITSKTKAVIPVHVGGLPCNMPEIMKLANQYDLVVIEDCAQAHGAVVAGKQVGAWGHAAIFSFCQDKIISTGGEGGMLLLNDDEAYKKAWAYKDIGRSYDAVYHREHPDGFRWLTESAGSNFRMTEFQAAIGLKQLAKLRKWIEKRNEHAKVLFDVLKGFEFLEVHTFLNDDLNKNASYRFYARVKAEFNYGYFGDTSTRDVIVNRMTSDGVPCFSGACSEIYREKVFADLGYVPKIPNKNAAFYTNHAFCFLVHHTITQDQILFLAKNIEQVLLKIDAVICLNGRI